LAKLNILILAILIIVMSSFAFSTAFNLVYDGNGNLISGDGYYRVYNSLNQLWKIYNGSNSSGVLLESYQYHPTEERIQVKTVYNSTGGVKETVYYISKSFVQVVNSSGEFNFTYVYEGGQLVAQKNPEGTKIFIHSDAEGSATVITNSTGSVIENTLYSPFGDVLSGGTKSRYGYEDKEKDSVVGDTDFNFRKYNPSWGIFLQPDTVIQNVYDPQGLNHYSFERNNPYKNSDPTGHNNEPPTPDEYAETGNRYFVMLFYFPILRKEIDQEDEYAKMTKEMSVPAYSPVIAQDGNGQSYLYRAHNYDYDYLVQVHNAYAQSDTYTQQYLQSELVNSKNTVEYKNTKVYTLSINNNKCIVITPKRGYFINGKEVSKTIYESKLSAARQKDK
jgi:RHS repeat-associated protein